MDVIDWERIPREQVTPLASRQIVDLPSMKLIRRTLRPGAVLSEHRHVEEQVCLVQTGKLRFLVEDAEHIVTSGEAFVIASDVIHSMEAIEDSVVIDLFATPHEGNSA